jgi:hypothetical protein
MASERWIAIVLLVVVGGGAALLGEFGRRGRLRYSLGAMTAADTTPEAWDRAHRRLGRWILVAAVLPLVGGLVGSTAPTGAIGPVVLATTLGSGGLGFTFGALIEAVAVIGFALAYVVLFAQSERQRVGFYAVLAGAGSGVVGVGFGLSFAFGHLTPSLVLAHFRLNVLGFLGLTIVGIAYQFYPPAIGTLRGASNRAALVSIGSLAGGLFIQVVGLVGQLWYATLFGEILTLVGAMTYAYLIVAVFHAR